MTVQASDSKWKMSSTQDVNVPGVHILGQAEVYGQAEVSGHAEVSGEAKVAYAEAARLLKRIEDLLRTHKRFFVVRAQERDWGYVGDVRHVVGKLREVEDFLSGELRDKPR